MAKASDQQAQEGVGPMGMYRDVVEERYGAGYQYAAALSLMLAGRRLGNEIGAVLRTNGLTMPQWSVLTILHLAPADQIPLGRIAQALEVHGTTITNAVDRLVDVGLVARAVDPADRRSIRASITTAGAERADTIMRALAGEQFGLSGLSRRDLEMLIQLVDGADSA